MEVIMSIIIKHREDLISYIKYVILKYCPYMDDRLEILDNAKSPELDIKINIDNNESQIIFMFGNCNFKESIKERATTSYAITFEEIKEIINFILDDHEVIKNISFDNQEIDLKFAINWTNKSVKGINCNDIELNLNFENMDIKKQYLYLIFQKYYSYLEHTASFKLLKNEYINSVKHSYFDTLDKNELISLLNGMSEIALKELLCNLDNELFIKYFFCDREHRVRVLSLKDNNKNN